MELCNKCGGLKATENLEMIAGTICKCLVEPEFKPQLDECFGWLKEFAEFTKDEKNCFLIAGLDGSIEIYVNANDWIVADDYETALRQYLIIKNELEEDTIKRK